MPSTPGLFGLAALHATTDTMQPGETAIVDGVLYNRDGDADPVPVGGSGGSAGGGVFVTLSVNGSPTLSASAGWTMATFADRIEITPPPGAAPSRVVGGGTFNDELNDRAIFTKILVVGAVVSVSFLPVAGPYIPLDPAGIEGVFLSLLIETA